ncbi:PBECR4 domain-containing protein [Planococcus faecalis]|uniref:PBECR4 domain-containing protein n=1 Tax=Planococcus faecalis TaxID=1598147 RepID=UPI0008DACB0D|nr:PBECR4 domain-containing protein [Planococcus faecalis]
MDDKRTLLLLQRGLEAYEKLKNKELHYVYLKNGKYRELVFTPKKEHFLHLCGLNYINPKTNKPSSAKDFYGIVKKGKMNLRNINKGQHSDQKLQIIDQLDALLSCNVRVLDTKTTSLNLTFYRGLRTGKAIFCLALTEADEYKPTGEYVPLSLLDIRRNHFSGPAIPKGEPVHCVYLVHEKSREVEIISKNEDFVTYESRKNYLYEGMVATTD